MSLAREGTRLGGQHVRVCADAYVIDDVAGEGAPRVGRVERRGAELWLVTDELAVRLVGALATPRIAGPGYKVWVLGERSGDSLRATRIGVLALPSR